MESLLFLSHRIPFPPNKGDKIRSFNLLKHLSKKYNIYLGAFIDDKEDRKYINDLRQWCKEVFLVEINPRYRKILSLYGLVTGESLSIPYYRHHSIQKWVNQCLAIREIKKVVIFSSPMSQYILTEKANGTRCVIDFVDVDSEKWMQYSQKHCWPLSWIYRREGKKLLQFDRKASLQTDVSVFVSAEESSLFSKLAPDTSTNNVYMENGVDAEYFSPDRAYANPYPDNADVIVFTGAMDYWANIDAVVWFANKILPKITKKNENARFYIVGSHPSDEVLKLAKISGVTIVGAVKDVRPYVANSSISVAPLRIARGLQNKVLEAMAMQKPVVATPSAMEGIRVDESFFSLVTDDEDSFSERCISLLEHGDINRLGEKGRQLIIKEYSWESNLEKFDSFLR